MANPHTFTPVEFHGRTLCVFCGLWFKDITLADGRKYAVGKIMKPIRI